MTTMTKHVQGTFCWPELYVPDVDQGKKFYTSLFGWTFNDTPLPAESGGGVYTIFQLGGRDVAAMYRLVPEMQKSGLPPSWGTYIAVESADAAAKKAKELGAKVMMEPFDVMEHGRMASIMDPSGATFSVWQAKNHIGVQVREEPGALSWNELHTRDVAKAKAFYTSLFGYKTGGMTTPEGFDYTLFKDSRDDTQRAGMMPIHPKMGAAPSNWLTYFGSADIRKSVDKAKSLGAKVHVEVTPIPQQGQFAVLEDPQGVPFALFQPDRI